MCVEGGFFFFKINKRDSTFIREMRVSRWGLPKGRRGGRYPGLSKGDISFLMPKKLPRGDFNFQ
jgi:hypothetical protein